MTYHSWNVTYLFFTVIVLIILVMIVSASNCDKYVAVVCSLAFSLVLIGTIPSAKEVLNPAPTEETYSKSVFIKDLISNDNSLLGFRQVNSLVSQYTNKDEQSYYYDYIDLEYKESIVDLKTYIKSIYNQKPYAMENVKLNKKTVIMTVTGTPEYKDSYYSIDNITFKGDSNELFTLDSNKQYSVRFIYSLDGTSVPNSGNQVISEYKILETKEYQSKEKSTDVWLFFSLVL